jgi:hypothetical protein
MEGMGPMARRARRVFLILGLVLSLLVVAIGPASASKQPPDGVPRLYLPWIPTGAVIDDPRGFPSSGPYYGTVTVQNLEDEEIILYYKATADPENFSDLANFHTTLVGPRASRTIAIPQLQLAADVDGTGVVLAARKSANPASIARIAAVQKQAAPVAIDVDAKTHAGHMTVGGYSALVPFDIAPVIRLPIVQTNSNWNTLIRATNFEAWEDDVEIHLTLRPAGGGEALQFTKVADAGETVTFDLLELGVPEEWVGSAMLSSAEVIGAVAERVKNETNMLIVNSARSAPFNGELQYAPLVFRDWFHWNTGISVVNVEAVPIDVAITYYGMDGEVLDTDDLTLPADSMDFVYRPSGLEEDDSFVGSAAVDATGRFLAVVDEVKYLGDDDDTGHAMSYAVESDAIASAGQSVALPLFQKGSSNDGQGDTSGIQLFNPGSGWVQFSIWVYDQFGVPVLYDPGIMLEGKHGYTFYAFAEQDLPDGLTGAVVVGVIASQGDGALVAVSNNVNYAVQFDGSVSFNLFRIGGFPAPVP